MGRDDAGAVTVEAAIALAALALITALAVGAVAAGAASVRCVDAARELARLAARGEPDRGRAVAERLAPTGAAITLTVAGDEAVAEVSTTALGLLPIRVGARAVSALEPGAAESATVEPGAVEPGAVEPGAVEPGAVEPAAVAADSPAPWSGQPAGGDGEALSDGTDAAVGAKVGSS